MVIGIIGAGASGMAAAISASECPDVNVILFERQSRVGRKLQATGNGRCNLSNLNADKGGLHGQNSDFARNAMSRYDVENTLAWFGELGLYTVSEEMGRVYPYSDQANSVVDVLRFALQRDNIRLITGFEVSKVKKSDDGFRVEGNGEVYSCDKLIIACGGLAGTKLGGSMSGYQLLRSFGHHITKLRPSLVQLKSSWSGCAALKGVRANCSISVFNGDMLHAKSIGELQFTEYGLSGPVVFEVSRDACSTKGNWHCLIDLLPAMDEQMLLQLLKKRRSSTLLTDELFTGILHNRLGRVLTQTAGIRAGVPISSLRDDELRAAAAAAKALDVVVTEPLGMEHAQVTAGGAVTDEFDPLTMESRLVPGLYACGEVLDIDGDCGGYNLQWAWSSGRLAGKNAGVEK
ncbi:MAG: aminoacetone oxidase family FAD-binding enzyme [Ruminococcaceae bacterium]|nr:aminoacetone oxidase family FAD-binding enzyme [Oscillospiraceae bacterium]